MTLLIFKSRDLDTPVTLRLPAGEPVTLGRACGPLATVLNHPTVSRRQLTVTPDADGAARAVLECHGRNPCCIVRRASHTRKMVHAGQSAVVHAGDTVYIAHGEGHDSGEYPFILAVTHGDG
jgi:hypothetical protein